MIGIIYHIPWGKLVFQLAKGSYLIGNKNMSVSFATKTTVA